MVKELLVSETLSDAMINSGVQLVQQLDRAEADVQSAFWFYISEEHTWKLIFASPRVSEEGPRKYYKRIIEANKAISDKSQKISLSDIGVSTTDNSMVQLLSTMIKTDSSINHIRFSKNTINGHFIDDVYIYRMQ
ncbi:hypothetical protein ACSVUS_004841 [Vibrio alginolyticus]|uniref:hypothetical protein n=1 Tax=Vibrio TaxID=662 RepID=UPI0015584DB6|nr:MULTISPECIES: hypothetical protein [Vibrio]EGQ9765568.1 hypothetical protein [Vibrio alginolyticus]EGR1564189.1 hypothetical protein [Vibrio alginolyticus]EHI5144006.1 hypothetical protein [Vibrio alginolyticus]EIE5866310.1 hypothetical protein [Vibrio alginolyticus]EJG1639899.1 hypothetical protein [Vibrio alginolyticus]